MDTFWAIVLLGGIVFYFLNKAGNAKVAEQQRQADQQSGQTALELERLRLAELQRQKELELAKGGSLTAKIKAYGVPLAIGGVIIIGGISAYFYFKKKK